MSVIAKFIYEIKPGGFGEFMAKLGEAANSRFNSSAMPQSVRLFRSVVPGPGINRVQLFIEYRDLSAFGARTDFENGNAEWRELFDENADSPQRLVSVELLAEIAMEEPR